MTAALALADLGIAERARSGLPTEQLERLAATLDLPRSPAGGAIPLLWHWAFFPATVPTSDLGVDGHPRLPAAGATQGLPRRMFAGGRVRSLAALRPDVPAERRARLVAAVPKVGRSGRLLLVTVRYELHQGGRLVREEEQSLVYREQGAAMPLPTGSEQPASPRRGWREQITVDRVRLFRFSAVTFNSHRIHYDADYAAAVEGYPGLVVHGPLVAMLLSESARVHTGREVTAFEFRATAPLFEGEPFWVLGQPDGDRISLSAVRGDATTAMHATAQP